MGRKEWFENTRVYELRGLKGASAFSLPGIGIFVGLTYSTNYDLLRHEYGHILQGLSKGFLSFYFLTAPLSLFSAFYEKCNKNYLHKNARVEIEANTLAYSYFAEPENWDILNFPLKKVKN
jgi:hypothetical protein